MTTPHNMTTPHKLMSFVICAGLATMPAFAQAAAKTDESKIEGKIKKDTDLQNVKIKVDRVVTLSGKVASEADKTRAEKLANIAGVTKVDNQIEVSDRLTKDRIDDRAEAAKDRTQDRADIEKKRIDAEASAAKAHVEHKDGNKTNAGFVEDVSDTWITTKLKTQFTTESVFKDSAIRVDTNAKGLVTLDGTVPTEAAHAKALEVSRSTKGVRDIKDNLKVIPVR